MLLKTVTALTVAHSITLVLEPAVIAGKVPISARRPSECVVWCLRWGGNPDLLSRDVGVISQKI
jgi:hypothetical protein